MIDFVLSLDWAQLRHEFDCEQSDFQTSLMNTLDDFPFTVIQHICEFTAPLWEGNNYKSDLVYYLCLVRILVHEWGVIP